MGDPIRRDDALERWYRDHYDRLRAFCVRRLRDDAAADDIAQETLLRAWTRRDTFEPDADIAPWLFHVARNLCTDHMRARSRLVHTITLPEEPTFDEDPVEREEMSALVRTALAGLNERQQQVLMARDVHGLEYAEVARRMGVSEETARAVLCRARRGLRKRFLAVARATAMLGLWPLIRLRELIRKHLPAEQVAAFTTASVGLAAVVAIVVVPGVLRPAPPSTPSPRATPSAVSISDEGAAVGIDGGASSSPAARASTSDDSPNAARVRLSGDRRGEVHTNVSAPNPATGEDADVWANIWREQDEGSSIVLDTTDTVQGETCASATSTCDTVDALLAGTEEP